MNKIVISFHIEGLLRKCKIPLKLFSSFHTCLYKEITDEL